MGGFSRILAARAGLWVGHGGVGHVDESGLELGGVFFDGSGDGCGLGSG